MTERYNLIFCSGILVVGIYCGYLLGDFIRSAQNNERFKNEVIAATIPGEANYSVTVDGAIYYCQEIEYLSGFPMIIILHDGDDSTILRASKKLAIKKQ